MKHFLPFAAILMSLTSCGSNYKNLDIAEFEKTIADGAAAVVDVRTPDEYAAGHLQGAANCDWYASDFLAQIKSTYPKGTLWQSTAGVGSAAPPRRKSSPRPAMKYSI